MPGHSVSKRQSGALFLSGTAEPAAIQLPQPRPHPDPEALRRPREQQGLAPGPRTAGAAATADRALAEVPGGPARSLLR